MSDQTAGYPGTGRELDALVAERVMGICLHDLRENAADQRTALVAAARAGWEKDYGQPPPPTWEPDLGDYDTYYQKCLKCGQQWQTSGNYLGPRNSPRPYSTDIPAAWQVVEKMHPTQGFGLVWNGHNSWHADFALGVADAPTVALAICLAALKAVAAPVPGQPSVSSSRLP